MDQSIIDLHDEYTHRPLARRVFLERLAALAGSTAAAHVLLGSLENNYAQAATVPENDARVLSGTFDVNDGKIKGYVSYPRGVNPDAATNLVIVVHENRGLNPHIKDVTRRFATEGFLAMAPDFLTPLGGTPEDEDKAREMFAKIEIAAAVATAMDMVSGYKSRNAAMRVGAVGFCWGGGLINSLATAAPDLDAGVVYYGVAPKLEGVPGIKAAMMMHHAGLDQRVNATLPPYEAALKSANIPYQLHMYEGVNHAFNNDTAGDRYNEPAAALAWSRTVGHFRQKLSA